MFCPGCGKEVPDAYAGVRCPSCGASLIPGVAPSGGPGAPPPPPGSEGIPWENRRTLGFFPALLENVRQCLFEAAKFFEQMPKRENLGAALGYLAILGWVGAVGGFLWSLALRAPQEAFLRSLGIQPPARTLGHSLEGIIFFLGILFAPVLILIVAFIWSAILHVILWIIGGAREGFEATLRVYSYSAGSTSLFQLIPVCGSLVGLIWSLVLQTIGLSRAHGISPGKAAVAVLLPLALCCVVVVAFAVLFAGFLTAAIRGGGA
jgi:hypothetical protein